VSDRLQHHNELAYRLLTADPLSSKVLADSTLAVSVLGSLPEIRKDRVGMLGHSYGGSTALFHAPLDARIRFAAASGCERLRLHVQGKDGRRHRDRARPDHPRLRAALRNR